MSESSPLPLQITLVFAPAAPNDVDPAIVSGTASETATALRAAGYNPKAKYTQERGGTAYEIILETAKALADNKDVIIAMAGVATPIITHLLKKREERAARGRQESQPPTIIVQVNDYSRRIPIEPNLSDAQVLQHMLLEDKALDVALTPQNQAQITVEVPSPARRRS